MMKETIEIGVVHARRRVLAIVDEREVTVVALDTGKILSVHRTEPDRGAGAIRDETRADGRGLRRPADHTCRRCRDVMCHLCRDSRQWWR